MRRDPRAASVPVLVCTASIPELEAHRQELRDWGCDILLKPFSVTELLERVQRLTTGDGAGG